MPHSISYSSSCLLQCGDVVSCNNTIIAYVQVLVVPEPGSDSATVSEDLADDCGLYSPMLSPRQQGAGGSGGSSSAEDLTIELTSPTGRSSDFFAPPAEMRAPALSPGAEGTHSCWSACAEMPLPSAAVLQAAAVTPQGCVVTFDVRLTLLLRQVTMTGGGC